MAFSSFACSCAGAATIPLSRPGDSIERKGGGNEPRRHQRKATSRRLCGDIAIHNIPIDTHMQMHRH